MSTSAPAVNESYEKRITIAIPIVFSALATVVYLARLYARRMTAAKFGIDDVLMAVGLLLSFGATFSVVWGGFNGIGQNKATLPPAERRRLAISSWLIQKFWPTSLAFIKSSIIVFLQRLFHANKRFHLATTIIMVIVCLWALSAILVNTFQCTPVDYFWNKKIKGGHCIDQIKFYQAMGCISLITDVAILVAPLPVIWGLHLNIQRKLALVFIFSVGTLVWIFSLLRIIYLKNFQVNKTTLSSVLEVIFTCLEIDMAIFCGCLPTLQPLFKRFLPGMFTSNKQSYSNPTNPTSRGQLSSAASNKVLSNRYKRKTKGGFEDEGFERIVDGKSFLDKVYGGIPVGGSESSNGIPDIHVNGKSEARSDPSALEMGHIEVRTDLDQSYADRGKDQHSGMGVTNTSWPV